MRFGQFLFFILLLLIAFALFGITDWNTVWDWGLIMVILAVSGFVLVIFTYIFFQLKEKAGNKSVKSKIGKFVNWLIILVGIIIVASIFMTGYLGSL